MSTTKNILNNTTIREINNENKHDTSTTEKHLKHELQNITRSLSTMKISNKENSAPSFETRGKVVLSPNKKMISKRVNFKLNKSEVTAFPKDAKAKIKYTF
eukprot:gene3946-7156_t